MYCSNLWCVFTDVEFQNIAIQKKFCSDIESVSDKIIKLLFYLATTILLFMYSIPLCL